MPHLGELHGIFLIHIFRKNPEILIMIFIIIAAILIELVDVKLLNSHQYSVLLKEALKRNNFQTCATGIVSDLHSTTMVLQTLACKNQIMSAKASDSSV